MRQLPAPEGPRMLLFRCTIEQRVSRFMENIERATEKRMAEHSSGRWLLEQALKIWGITDLSSLEILRDTNRAPRLSWIQGTWRREPLPSFSIAHCNNAAVVAIIEPGYNVGIDAEPKERGIMENAFDMMSSGKELDWLRNNPDMAIKVWTTKEAVQKAYRLGMNLNPRKIIFDDLKIDVRNFVDDDLQIAIAWLPQKSSHRTAEDDLLDMTAKAIRLNEDFTVGCNR